MNSQGPTTTWQILHTFVSRLILEVFGGAGAIWGFSEASGLRTSSTNWFWRPTALLVGFLFFLRWSYQLYVALGDYYREDDQWTMTTPEKKALKTSPNTADSSVYGSTAKNLNQLHCWTTNQPLPDLETTTDEMDELSYAE
jgi:hypothetical protein